MSRSGVLRCRCRRESDRCIPPWSRLARLHPVATCVEGSAATPSKEVNKSWLYPLIYRRHCHHEYHKCSGESFLTSTVAKSFTGDRVVANGKRQDEKLAKPSLKLPFVTMDTIAIAHEAFNNHSSLSHMKCSVTRHLPKQKTTDPPSPFLDY